VKGRKFDCSTMFMFIPSQTAATVDSQLAKSQKREMPRFENAP
jgi:hypothetical protein